jgi:hypothetical protein
MILGVLAILCFTLHAAWHLRARHPEELLWGCSVGVLGIGIGLCSGAPHLVGVGTLWLALGAPLWALDLVSGGKFVPTSPLLHLGGLCLGILGVLRSGLPRGTWLWALGGAAALAVVSRLCTPPAANVNLCRSIQPGWTRWFRRYPSYLATVYAVLGGGFWLVETALRRVAPGMG